MSRAARDSGVGWLGAIPKDWRVVPARALFGERKRRSAPADVHLTPSQKFGVLPQAEYMEVTGNRVVLNLSGADNMRHVEAGDYVSHLRSFQGGLEYAGIPGKVSAAYTVLKPKFEIDPRFFRYLFKSDLYIQALQTTTDQLRDGQSIRYSQFTLIPLPAPSLAEQRAIADYLDRETAQIDRFIAKTEELITLLTERRAATIAHSVTRGRNPAAPLKASGVEWLGDVPAHWTVTGLARFATTVSGSGFPENEQGNEEAEIAFYKVNALGQADADGVIRNSWDTISRATAQTLRAKILPPGTILLAKIGAALLLGRIRRTDRVACIDNNMMAMVPNEELSPRFASYALQTFDFEALANPGTVPSMDMYALMHRKTAVPPLPEQIDIAEYLDRRLSETDAALDTCRLGIQLARERRAALISAAVTGKIDVGVAT